MTALGELKVEFSTPMVTNFVELERFNSTIIDMYIIPANGREKEEDFRWQSINFTWNVTEYGALTKETSHIVFKLAFEEPLQISPLKI
jgi:hypothetical protein